MKIRQICLGHRKVLKFQSFYKIAFILWLKSKEIKTCCQCGISLIVFTSPLVNFEVMEFSFPEFLCVNPLDLCSGEKLKWEKF